MRPITAPGDMTGAGFTGNRTTLIISVVWSDFLWGDATAPGNASVATIPDILAAGASYKRLGLRTFGKLSPQVTVSPCVYRLPEPFTTAFANTPATGPDSSSWMSSIRVAATAAVKAAAGQAANVNGTSILCPALDPNAFHNFAVRAGVEGGQAGAHAWARILAHSHAYTHATPPPPPRTHLHSSLHAPDF